MDFKIKRCMSLRKFWHLAKPRCQFIIYNIISWNNEKSMVTSTIMSSSLNASERSLVEIGRKRLSPADARVNIAAGRNFAGPWESSSSRRVLLLPVRAFCGSAHKGNRANSGGRSPLTITPMRRPSEAARTAGCAVAKRKPQTGGIFFFHEDTRTTRSARLPYYIPHTHVEEEEEEEELVERGWWRKEVNAASKYNQTED